MKITEKLLKEFIKSQGDYSEMFQTLWDNSGLSIEDLSDAFSYKGQNHQLRPRDGSVVGYIYYSDTERVAKEIINDFASYVKDYDFQDLFLHATDSTNFLNEICWLAWDEFVYRLEDYINE